MISPNIDTRFKIVGVLDRISALFRTFSFVYVYEFERDESYSIILNSRDYWPVLDHKSLTLDSDISFDSLETKAGLGIKVNIRKINLQIPELRLHREVEIDGGAGHIFREGSRWLVILGTNEQDRVLVSHMARECLGALRRKKAS